jgi:hypothetical protein
VTLFRRGTTIREARHSCRRAVAWAVASQKPSSVPGISCGKNTICAGFMGLTEWIKPVGSLLYLFSAPALLQYRWRASRWKSSGSNWKEHRAFTRMESG